MSDESKEQPLLRLTATAAGELQFQLGRPENAGKMLRVYVEQGGCSGMQYSMTFDEPRDNDLTATEHGVSVLVDSFSADYLRGSVVDYSDSLTGGGFKLTNPNATQTCGCGKSFAA